MEGKVDYYISLIGKNPLPNYISALEYCEDATQAFFIYTMEENNTISTKIVAENIKLKLTKEFPNTTFELIGCKKNNYKEIEKSISKLFNNMNDKAKIVLDYTGCTKIISSIFYDAFKEKAKNSNFEIYASYTSNKGSKTVIYEELLDSSKDIETIAINDIVKNNPIKSGDIIELHGYKANLNGTMLKNLTEIKHNKIDRDSENNGIKDIGKMPNVELNEDYNLLCTFEHKLTKKKDNNYIKRDNELIKDYFKFREIAEKIGGTEVNIIIKLIGEEPKNIDFDELKRYFYDRIKNVSTNGIEKKVKLKLEGIESDE